MASVFQKSKRGLRKPSGSEGSCAAIFVHAGAGYHSVQNEGIHLRACHDAAKTAMALLSAGASAVVAVEMAIRVLEDREITNAGYGSNLAIDGTVEGDAVIVDHLGRSGACGAVPNIKNPISLAREVLHQSKRELTLRRVPPNLLVGQGAVDFAYQHSLPIVPNKDLVSPAAQERWNKWREDLRAVEGSRTRDSPHLVQDTHQGLQPSVNDAGKPSRLPLWNEGQPVTPLASTPVSMPGASETRVDHDEASVSPSASSNEQKSEFSSSDSLWMEGKPDFVSAALRNVHGKVGNTVAPLPRSRGVKRVRNAQDATEDDRDDGTMLSGWHASHHVSDGDEMSDDTLRLPSLTPSPKHAGSVTNMDPGSTLEDRIVDTVGAIAIDKDGNIACGASSGGIGMKFRGRTGPAALVGVGAAVVPANQFDKAQVTTAAVTSGTGEHMTTTQAASVCADRLYHNLSKTKTGNFVSVEDDDAVTGMIQQDFMQHPAVINSQSTGAIGVMTIKKTHEGVYLYFAHNTDSFAVASMHADDAKPMCTMSRSRGNGGIASGGRAIKFKRR